jgi:hypothetical protein
VFNAIDSVHNRKILYENMPDCIPDKLDPEIEKHFSEKQRKVRKNMFIELKRPQKSQKCVVLEGT